MTALGILYVIAGRGFLSVQIGPWVSGIEDRHASCRVHGDTVEAQTVRKGHQDKDGVLETISKTGGSQPVLQRATII